MRGYVVDKQGKPVQFRVLDPESGQISTCIAISSGTGMRLVDASQVVVPGMQRQQAQPTPPQGRIGAMPGEVPGAPAPAMPEHEPGVVVERQAQPRPTPQVQLTPEQARAAGVMVPQVAPPAPPAPAQEPVEGDDTGTQGDRPAVLQTGAAQEL